MRRLWINKIKSDYNQWKALLLKEGIRPEKIIDATYGVYDNSKLIATASRYKNVLKCVAIDSNHQGSSIFNEITSHLINEVFEEGYHSIYVYTKESAKNAFSHLGFKEIEHIDKMLYFMEKAISGFDDYLKTLEIKKILGENIASIVMNANPFTKGHKALVEKASKENDILHIFVLSEDMSAFSTHHRYEIVKKGVSCFDNVYVHPTSHYMVSSSTFPSYFLKEEDDLIGIQARLDARIFKNHIAPALNINRRYVGSEPFSHTTNIYNRALKKEFHNFIDLIIVDRISVNGEIISATKVRELLKQGNLSKAKELLPDTTYRFLLTPNGQETIKKLQQK